MHIPLSETSSLVLICDGGLNYPSLKARAFLKNLDLSKGQVLYQQLKHLSPYMQDAVRNRKFFLHNYIEKILLKENGIAQVLILGCGWDPLLIKMSELFPKSFFFGVDSAIEQQFEISKQLLPDSHIFYIEESLTHEEYLVNQLLDKGWNKNLKTCIVIEGITYYVPPKNLWNTIQHIKNQISSDCVICGDFLMSWSEENLSTRGQLMAQTIFNTIQQVCSLKEYYPYTQKGITDKLISLGLSQIHFFRQDEIQKQRTKSTHPWNPEDSYLQLFTGHINRK